MEAEEVIDHIWENWKQNQGACQGCPARDSNGGWPLYFGQGSLSTDLMLIAEEPGGANDRHYEDGNGYAPRTQSDYPENKWDTIDEHHPRAGSTEINIIEPKRIYPSFFNNIENYSKDLSDSDKTPYYTNTKKSEKIHGEDFQSSDSPVQRCLPYLDLEIGAIDPKVIVLIGDDATENFASRFPINMSSSTYDDLFEILNLDEGPPYLVRSYHWGNGIPLDYTPADSEYSYWEMLGNTVNKALNK